MIGLLLKGIFREISGFNEEILIYLLESFVFGGFFDNIQICIQFYNLQQQLLFYDFLFLQTRNFIYCTYMSPKIMSFAHLLNFFLLNDIQDLQTTLISTKYNQKNKNNNIKLNSKSTEPYILLQRVIRLQNKLNGKIRL